MCARLRSRVETPFERPRAAWRPYWFESVGRRAEASAGTVLLLCAMVHQFTRERPADVSLPSQQRAKKKMGSTSETRPLASHRQHQDMRDDDASLEPFVTRPLVCSVHCLAEEASAVVVPEDGLCHFLFLSLPDTTAYINWDIGPCAQKITVAAKSAAKTKFGLAVHAS
ncbi:hypothetical protein HPB50_009595 [Hyalomma asiaticum]|uniref:Uncharacterized protein n=1 Tax=Hyalomma asiaticum TaxID=266040 RepID=A0ACB7SPT3_HYAAI|nr:hypothetical protein HPB50_009595 [Hyalomma asiaticum]